jgi:hypothetical protein
MNPWIVTDKERGERWTSYRVFNSLTGQAVLVQQRDYDPIYVFSHDSMMKISADQERVIQRTIEHWFKI